MFVKFLIDSNCCILNGRNFEENGCTFVSSRGKSVVDYIVIPYEDLDCYSKFRVTSPIDIVIHSQGNETKTVPDHSILSCTICLRF